MTGSSETVISVRVKPRARRDEVRRSAGDEIEVRVAAPPARGAANERLLRVLAEYLGVPPGDLRIVAGRRGRHKRIAVRARPGA